MIARSPTLLLLHGPHQNGRTRRTGVNENSRGGNKIYVRCNCFVLYEAVRKVKKENYNNYVWLSTFLKIIYIIVHIIVLTKLLQTQIQFQKKKDTEKKKKKKKQNYYYYYY